MISKPCLAALYHQRDGHRMKIHIPLLLIIATSILVVSCILSPHKNAPIGRGNKSAPVPTHAMAKQSGFSYDAVGRGYDTYMIKCGECHMHILPDDIPAKDWHNIVPGMAWNSGIAKSDEDNLLKYLIAAKQ